MSPARLSLTRRWPSVVLRPDGWSGTTPAVDWSAASLVAVRSTWDYVGRQEEFLSWARSLDQSRRLNGAAAFEWNHDKRYLTELGDLPTVPTVTADDRAELSVAVARFGTAVVKPRVGAGGAGLLMVTDPDVVRLGPLLQSHPTYPPVGGPWVAQPLVESIRTHGEVSLYMLAGEVTCRFDKLPADGDIRVNEEFGGSLRQVPVGKLGGIARRAYVEPTSRFGRPLDYVRVDLLRWEDEWAVSELELIEPGLYLDITDASAGPFADLVASRLT